MNENIPIKKRKIFQLEKGKYSNYKKENIPITKWKIFQLEKENIPIIEKGKYSN